MTAAERPGPAFLPLLSRFVRLQFLPVIVAPVLLGASLAWRQTHSVNPWFFLVALLGSCCLLLAANAIDDVYDELNGVDDAVDRLFPPQFPGWKPLTRGAMTMRAGFLVSAALYGLAILAGVYLSAKVGWTALGIAVPGIVLSYFYTAPPLKLDYRGLGLGELSILVSFGPVPCLGMFYVLTMSTSVVPVLASIPAGLLTACLLMTHDMIFYEPYAASGKRSLTVALGYAGAARAVMALSVLAYAIVIGLVAIGLLPWSSLVCLLALPFLRVGKAPPGVPHLQVYGRRTQRTFLHSVLFTLLLAAGTAVSL